MHKKRNFMKYCSLFISAAFVLSFVSSCGGGGSSGPSTVNYSSPDQAAASSTVGMAAISLSEIVGSTAQIATDSIPAGYAPGKTGSGMNTAPIAKIDPRLKDMVDKMVAQLQKPAVKNSLAKMSSYKTVSSAPLSSVTGSCSTVTDSSIVSSGTSTTYTVTVTINGCRTEDTMLGIYEDLNGTISGTHTVDSTNQYTSAEVAANLTSFSYTDETYTTWKEKGEMSGTFGSQIMGDIFSNATGTNSANGAFTVTTSSYSDIPNVKMAFSFKNVRDVWSISTVGSDQTNTHTANGSYTLAMTDTLNSETLTLSIGLTNLENKIKYYGNGDEDMWINGSVTINWTPDLSQWGCLNGTYNFTTITPIYTGALSYCPTSGILQVNNATIEFGVPSGSWVTVTLTGGASAEFPDCDYLGGGMCGG